MCMDLQLGLALSATPYEPREALGYNNCRRKRRFDHEILRFDENRDIPKTLSLLLWTKQPNDDDDDPEPEDLEHSFSSAIFTNDEEGLVGWPPVKTWRNKLQRQIPNGGADNNHVASENDCGGNRASNSTYVKVKMEGVGIGRKIDIGVHHSFETLTTTLMTMFDIFDENRKNFKLTYQDKEGDWLLAEDVPWRTFVGSIKCLKLIRSSG
ncbi:AUX/IAA transcriptional regulator family protein, putative isoform 2 [Hibiscus syriacus]|uniref:Auxin-responsive protein n=1 Tax=Hibiscus syriacus TaxID=106335 RepID=A0A6A2WG82_HIBSY|nr:auxin-responsive protein IAA29-like [Hibiscus syriacus]KAE8657882.1 AUX/IAA transcriptional regulator family protein, putative isoform 2 [Hibiscus syriacus]